MMIIGQFIPGSSLLHRIDPRAKIGFVFCLMFLIFFANNLSSYVWMGLFIWFSYRLARIPFWLALRSLRTIWFLILLTSLLHLWLTQEGTIIYQFYGITFYEEGINKAVRVSLRFTLLVLTASLLTFTTSAMDLIDGLERIFQPFARLGFPAHEFALMMSIALRFIPVLWDELQKVKKAQLARGSRLDEGWIWVRMRYYIPLFIPLFISIFRRSDELAIAMESRCYRGDESRTRLRELHFTRIDQLSFVVVLVVVGVLFWLRG